MRRFEVCARESALGECQLGAICVVKVEVWAVGEVEERRTSGERTVKLDDL